MKLFLSSCLLLALVPNFAGAIQLSGKESLIFTSSPHPRMKPVSQDRKDKETVEKTNKESRFQNMAAQYQWIKNYKPHNQRVSGIVINGSLTDSLTILDAKNDWDRLKKLLPTLDIPYLLGLGGNDYILNRELCQECAVHSVWYFNRHITEKMTNKLVTKMDINRVYERIGSLHYDFGRTDAGGTSGLKKLDAAGSLGYAVELGSNKNIYVIQLNGHVGPNLEQNKFTLRGIDSNYDISNDTFDINPVVGWLEKTLKKVEEDQLKDRERVPKRIVVAMNAESVDPEIITVLDKYKVNMRFLASDSEKCKKDHMLADGKFYCLGFSTDPELLELQLDYDDQKFRIFHRNMKSNEVTEVGKPVDFPAQDSNTSNQVSIR